MTIELIYWDSDTFLGLFQEEEGKVEYCRGTFERAKNGELVIVTSTLTLAEVLWMRNSPKITKDKAMILRKFFRHSHITILRTVLSEGSRMSPLILRLCSHT